jgi:CheY-like chemotaxis protein
MKQTDKERMEDAERQNQKLLREALDQAEKSSRAKTIFLNNMSHDIRTPMNAILGFARLARNHADDPELVVNYMNKILSSGDHLLSLINDVLDMSRIESGKMVIEEKECSILAIAHKLVDFFQEEMNAKDLEFTVSLVDIVNPRVICDERRLNQILLNCLSNAVKFTNPGGKVRVRVIQKQTLQTGYGNYEFRVEDTGIGMSPEFASHIFEPFERERSSTVSGIQGTGLGMAITRNLVHLMQGTIRVKSEEGKGSEFIISLQFPIAGEHEEEEVPEENSGEEMEVYFAGKHILLVDDVDLNREIAEVVLSEVGLLVDSVKNGREAVDRIEAMPENTYDLILMDIQMPVMDGYEASRQIRQNENEKKAAIPILAMTADAFEEDKLRALQAGMNGHLSKPIQYNNLYEALKEHLLTE